MARPTSITPSTEFGKWLTEEYEKRGLTQIILAERSEFRQSTINGYVTGLRVPNQEKIKVLVRALAGPDADEHTVRALLNAGLKAAGFAGLDGGAGPLETIVQEVGYDSDMLDEDGLAKLRQGVDAVVIGIMEQEKRRRGSQ